MDYGTLFFLIFCMSVFFFIFFGMRRSSSGSTPAAKGTDEGKGSSRMQMVEDIKMTKTSRVVDAISILDELSETSSNYRQYCELIGTSQREGGVIAPYSRKQVAYYEIRCYRIENRGSGDVETLVAHEKSFDPFYFKDDSCDTPIYVNIDSFGDNVMLINSTNHIEGPNSDFAKAVAGSSSSTSSSTSTSGVTAMVGEIASGIVHGFGRARDAVVAGLSPQYGFAFAGGGVGAGTSVSQDGWSRQFLHAEGKGDLSSGLDGFAKAGGSMMPGSSSSTRKAMKSNAQQGGDRAKFSGGGQSSQGNRSGGVYVSVGMPTGLGTFLGSSTPGGFSSVPHPMPRPTGHSYPIHTYHRPNMGDVVGDMITGMVLTSILDSMAQRTTVVQTASPQQQNVFRGYRLVEDVVPLGSPIYCIGEIYHHGTDVYMGKSLSSDYPTSCFATRPEVEVLASLGA